VLSPFTGIVHAKDIWARRGIPTLLALLAYGLIVVMIVNSLPKPKAHGGARREAT